MALEHNQLAKVICTTHQNHVSYADQVVWYNHNILFMSAYGHSNNINLIKFNKKSGPNYTNGVYISNDLEITIPAESGYQESFHVYKNGEYHYCKTKVTRIPDTDVFRMIARREENVRRDDNRRAMMNCIIHMRLQDIVKSMNNIDKKTLENSLRTNDFIRNKIRNCTVVHDKVFELLNKNCSIPILREWIPYIVNTSSINPIDFQDVKAYYADFDNEDNIYTVYFTAHDSNIERAVCEGLRARHISINNTYNPSEEASNVYNLTSYLEHFSDQLIEKTNNKFRAVFDPSIDSFTEKENNYFDYAEYFGKLKLFNAQKNVIAATSRSLNKNRSAFIVGEMGSGKTALAIASTYVNSKKDNNINIVMCPGHLVFKWQREVERLYPGATAYVIASFDDLIKIKSKLDDPKRKYTIFLIISKDTAKSNFTESPSVIYDKNNNSFRCPRCGSTLSSLTGVARFSTYSNHSIPKGVKNNTEKRINTYHDKYSWTLFLEKNADNKRCKSDKPEKSMIKGYNLKDYYKTPYNFTNTGCRCSLWGTFDPKNSKWIKFPGVGFIHEDMFPTIKRYYNDQVAMRTLSDSQKRLYTKAYNAIVKMEEEGKPLQVAPKKYSIAKYLREKYKNKIDYFIADEVHLYSSSNSAQANAFGDIVRVARKTIALTGTLLNGYANGIYYILYRLYSKDFVQNDFKYERYINFVEKYGVKRTTNKEILVNGYNAYWRQDGTTTKILPGISPELFTKFMMDKAVFISLEDMSTGLPKYTETPVPIKMNDEEREKYEDATSSIAEIISNNAGNSTSIALQAAQKLNLYPDQPFDVEPIFDANGKLAYSFKDIPKTTKEKLNYVSEKDLETLKITKKHIERGEKVLIYVSYVNKTECVDRLIKIFNVANIKACSLESSVAASKREEWIDKKVKEGYDVLICNPSLVETGLDLLSFTTIIFYQVGYNLFTMRQASRRSLRLNQPNDVNVYFLYYENTAQESVLSLMANKLQAAMAIEGKFSEEGLNAMSNNDSILTQIADSLVKNIEHKIDIGAFSSGIGTPEEDDGTRFELVNILEEKKKNKINFSFFNKTNKKKFNCVKPSEFLKAVIGA